MLTAIYHLFPPTIHPMVIHFTIAITYLAGLAGLAGLIFRRDSFFSRAYFFLLILAILATIAAGVAGVISEYYDVIPQSVMAELSTHKKFGELTGVLLVIATGAQWLLQRKNEKVSVISFLFTVGAVITVSIAGFIGGDMVYYHGLGIHAVGTQVTGLTAHK